MSAENKSLIRFAIEEVFNQKRPELIVGVYSADCIGSTPDGIVRGREGFRLFFEKYATAFPDFRIDFEYMVAEGNRVVFPYVFKGTNSGPLGVFPPTGQSVRVPGIIISRIADNWIRQQNLLWDNCTAWKQMWQTKGTNMNPGPEAQKAGL